jgi:arabinose-5-phosphate isomerase
MTPSRDESTAVGRALDAADEALARSARAVADIRPKFAAAAGALALLLDAKGRVAVTGLGKSGLVGAKIAATLASTGTPSFFVHAADALHGDAGMVTDDDVLLAISKSGATTEVVQFAGMTRRRGVKVVAMTGCDGCSPLCQLADATIDIGVETEADPWDLVPSTSTAVTAVVGDALAIALMVARDFGPDDFRVHHPGGALGERLRAGAAASAEPGAAP